MIIFVPRKKEKVYLSKEDLRKFDGIFQVIENRRREYMLEKLKKLNPINWFEKFVIKRVAKKVVSLFPEIKAKGVEIIETHKEELLEKIQITILKFIEEFKNK